MTFSPRLNLVGRFSLTEDDLGQAAAPGALVVEAGELKVFRCRRLQIVQGRGEVDFAVGEAP
jgi:hypothetical protein